MRKLAIVIAGAFLAPSMSSVAGELDAHQHGQGTVNIVLEGSALLIELIAPGADIVGFEHAPSVAAERSAVAAAKERLSDPMGLFPLAPKADCTVKSADVSVEGVGDQEAEIADRDDSHDHDKDDGHDHDKDDSHDHDKDGSHEKGKMHSVFHAEYMLTCKKSELIDEIRTNFFVQFPRSRKLTVNMIVGNGQSLREIDRDDPRIPLRGF